MNETQSKSTRNIGLVSVAVGGLTVLMAKSMEQPVMRTAPRWLAEGDRIQRQVDWSREQEQARWFTRIGWILAGGGVALVALSYALEDRGLTALAEKPE